VSEPVYWFAQSLLRSSSMQSVSLVYCFGILAGKGILPGEQENISAGRRRRLPMGKNDWMAGHLAGHPTPPEAIDLYPHGRYHDCNWRFFLGLAPPAATAVPKEPVGRNHGGKVDVYSIYKETHASDDPTMRERHYAGWSADRDSAIRAAAEIYEGRDSIEAALVIGNGPTGIEVVYRIEDEI
jgi:hypothetical protein